MVWIQGYHLKLSGLAPPSCSPLGKAAVSPALPLRGVHRGKAGWAATAISSHCAAWGHVASTSSFRHLWT